MSVVVRVLHQSLNLGSISTAQITIIIIFIVALQALLDLIQNILLDLVENFRPLIVLNFVEESNVDLPPCILLSY